MPMTSSAAGRARRPGRMATLTDVAALAGVSVATASQALNGNAVKAETRTKVQEAAAKLRYVPRGAARALRTGRSTSIALWIVNRPGSIAYNDTSFFYPLIRGALEAAQDQGYQVALHVTSRPIEEVGRQLLEEASRGTCAALVVVPQWANDGTYLHEVSQTGVPVVVVNDQLAFSDAAVSIDDTGGVSAAVRHLVDHGHRRVAYLAGPRGHLDAEQRLQAFYRVAAESGLHVPPGYVRRDEFTIAAGVTGLARLLDDCAGQSIPAPTALLAADDYVGAGVLQEASRRGISVPGDLAVVGYDDTEVARATCPPLTTVAQPTFALGRAAALAATRLAMGLKVDRSTRLGTSLVVRGSVGRPA